MTSPTVTNPTFEHHHNGLGLGRPDPRISWRFETESSTAPSWVQIRYEAEVKFSETETYSRTVESSESILVPWPFRNLRSRELASVRVRVLGRSTSIQFEGWSDWSASSSVEAALLDPAEFKANFIAAAERIGPHGPLQPLCFRREFILPEIPQGNARLYITAFGVFHAWINGVRLSDEEMAPGWTNYRSRLNYRIWDVTSLAAGNNEIHIEAAEGWYAGRLGFKGGRRFHYGDEIAVMAQLQIGDWTLLTDESWTCGPIPVTMSEIYDGEVHDFSESSIHDKPVKILSRPSVKLVAAEAPPVRVTETKPAVAVFKSTSGKTIIDFGQNLVGKLAVRNLELQGQVTFMHAEVMEHGELGSRPLREAKCVDTVKGNGIFSWTPKFTFHGFRYVQIDGWEPQLENISALVMHTDMKRRGFFHCSNSSVNQLHRNVIWSMRGNFLSVPTDCPQRDERLGWTGDLQVFCRTASFLYDTIGMVGEWLQDVASEQKNGVPPVVVPNVAPPNWQDFPQAVWDDVTVLAPDVLYEFSGDKDLLERQFDSMLSWLEQGVDRVEGLWNPDRWQLADWLDPVAPPEEPAYGRTDSVLVADAYLVHVTEVFAKLCAAMEKDAEATKYAKDAILLKEKFQHRYVTPAGLLVGNTQTGVALALHYNLFPPDKIPMAKKSLDRSVRSAGFRIATGFAGTPVICHALTKVGLSSLAYRMLLEKKCPSWMYPITMGATTIWERWDSMLPTGDINPGQMTSFNHYALGAVADWLHTTVGGISPLEPGWRRVRISPIPGGNIRWADISFDGPYGLVRCSWNIQLQTLSITVPPNTSAVVSIEGQEIELGSGDHNFAFSTEAVSWPPEPFVASYKPRPEDDIAV
ncbi:uncharacterized protein A1O9_11544 [Exophiala aquamarina CBS 119918]|uniref:alpha-L-rhamnosidase n=1 Tax=Exophiala aquamarina CBS 119918 TaxID=1182545 RepID=A0A072NWU0_9EURO|nr:uncharacterized protein A1O9_11544 [Exophiala aquamarina CBS 119918]KEF52304.1 hypothetical protein A1O9_11544 [Exophiala aquamarina CBS 119918]